MGAGGKFLFRGPIFSGPLFSQKCLRGEGVKLFPDIKKRVGGGGIRENRNVILIGKFEFDNSRFYETPFLLFSKRALLFIRYRIYLRRNIHAIAITYMPFKS